MALFLLICFALITLLSTTATADPTCNKNAWVRLAPEYKSGVFVSGTFQITSGKGAHDISPEALTGAFGDCFFENMRCTVDKDGGHFNCQARQEWQSTAWIGTGDIEFQCSNKGYHCYDVKWDRA